MTSGEHGMAKEQTFPTPWWPHVSLSAAKGLEWNKAPHQGQNVTTATVGENKQQLVFGCKAEGAR